jgi:lipase chaperone LimK
MIKFAARYTPGASLWYTRLALERLVIDQAQMMADPKAKSKMRRLENRYKKEQGQKYWWRPGKTAPDRAPNLENVLAPAP